MISQIGAGTGETVNLVWALSPIGGVLDELRGTHVSLDVVQKGKTLLSRDNRVGGVWVDHTIGDAMFNLDTTALRAGEYALMSAVQRPNGQQQRKIIRYLTLY